MIYKIFYPLQLSAIRLHEGGLYVFPHPNGELQVAKILKLDAQGAHLRIYSNLLIEFPTQLNEQHLYLSSNLSDVFSIGHIPLSYTTLESYMLMHVQDSMVSHAELEGYQIWLEAQGGYF